MDEHKTVKNYERLWQQIRPAISRGIDEAFNEENLDYLVQLLSDLQELQAEVEESIKPLL